MNCYEKAKELSNFTALIRTARDKAVEILKSFEENRRNSSVLRLNRVFIRCDKQCYAFPKTQYWLMLSLNRIEKRISLPIVFGGLRELLGASGNS